MLQKIFFLRRDFGHSSDCKSSLFRSMFRRPWRPRKWTVRPRRLSLKKLLGVESYVSSSVKTGRLALPRLGSAHCAHASRKGGVEISCGMFGTLHVKLLEVAMLMLYTTPVAIVAEPVTCLRRSGIPSMEQSMPSGHCPDSSFAWLFLELQSPSAG